MSVDGDLVGSRTLEVRLESFWRVGAEDPHKSFEIPRDVASRAIARVFETLCDRGARRARPIEMRVRSIDVHTQDLRLVAPQPGLVGSGFDHDDAFPEVHLGMPNGSVRAWNRQGTLESKRTVEKGHR